MSAILLLLRKADAQERITERIDLGEKLLSQPIQTYDDLEEAEAEEKIWHSFNEELLRRLFSSAELADEYGQLGVSMGGGMPNLPLDIKWFRKSLQGNITRLRAIVAKLELYQEADSIEAPAADVTANAPLGDAVFIVHGRAGREHEVARAVEQLGAEAVILQERLHHGSATLIEKLEREASACGYAIVVYTGDDEGRIVGSNDLDRRARENVVLELGYFVGLLGREKVTILRDPDVTVPSDFHGVGYYTIDDAGGWKTKVEGELRSAGLL